MAEGETRRQLIARKLREGPITVRDLARVAGCQVKSVLADLEHVSRSIRRPERLVQKPAECLACGFVFRDRTRVETPSRCPECRSEKIRDPELAIATEH